MIWAFYTIGLISMCKNHEIFCGKVITYTLYSAIFDMLHMTGVISYFAHAFLEQISSRGLLCTIKSWGWSDLGVRTFTKLFSQYSVL